MNVILGALVRRIKQRAYLDTDEEIARWIEEYYEQSNSHKPVVSGPASAVCDGFKECTDVKGIMCKCEGECELKDEPRVAPLEGFYRKKGQ
jgi:hypothetical protein